jgi:hypothetical protein
VAAGDAIFLFDVQALGGDLFQTGGGDGDDVDGAGGDGSDRDGTGGGEGGGAGSDGAGSENQQGERSAAEGGNVGVGGDGKQKNRGITETGVGDVEGVSLDGRRQLSASRPSSSSDGCIRSLKAVLEDPTVTKLMFDCRVDSDALFHQHGIRLEGSTTTPNPKP